MKKISNLHDLVAERQRLEQRISLLKRELHHDVDEIKQRFRPITRVVGFLTGNSSNDKSETNGSPVKSSLLSMGANLGIDLLIGSKLRKAGMLTKLLAPPLLRGIASSIVKKVKQITSKKK